MLTVAVALALICGATCLGVYGAQRYLVFEPDRTLHAASADYPFPVHDVGIAIPGKPGQTLHGWWIPAANPRAKVVLYLHGNDGNVSTSMDGIAPLRELGNSVFMIDYRGYGASGGGFPSEAGVYQDAQSAWDYLVHERGMNPANLFIYGHSLGGAIATELALRHPEAAGLVVESSFTSIYDMAMLEARYALLPVNLFLNQRFDSIAKVGQLRLPVLYIHGTADETVPFEMGQALYRATPAARGFVAVPSGKHRTNAAVGGAGLRSAIGRFVEEAGHPRARTTLASRREIPRTNGGTRSPARFASRHHA
jgi:pimeloyl-ACP methyl ester carboxylesterase